MSQGTVNDFRVRRTGAGTGVGRGIAVGLAQAGATVGGGEIDAAAARDAWMPERGRPNEAWRAIAGRRRTDRPGREQRRGCRHPGL